MHWWVNQGQSYAVERKHGRLFAAETNAAGRSVPHWSALRELRPGDVVFHYVKGAVRALSRVTAAATRHAHPPEQGKRPGVSDMGYLVRVEYFELQDPIRRDEIPLELRTPANGPFTAGNVRRGTVAQAYMSPLKEEFVAGIGKSFANRLPFDPRTPPRA